MTREDREFAKSRIEYLLKADNCLDKHDREALEMAIKALSRELKIEPCTTEYHRVYMKGWNEGRRKLVDAMEREIAI